MSSRFSGPIGMAPDGQLLPAESREHARQIAEGLAPAPLDALRRHGRPGHVRGALFGLTVGDALGTTMEFQQPDAPRFPELCRGPHRDMTGGGPFDVQPGQVTDDTQMACILAASIAEQGWVSDEDVADRYARWSRVAFDIGGQTASALAERGRCATPAGAGKTVWEKSQKNAAGNGSLMRTAPIGALLAADGVLRRGGSLDDSAVTHFDPRCQLACAAFNGAIACAVAGDRDASRLIDAAASELAAAAWRLIRAWPDLEPETSSAFGDLTGDLLAARRDDPELYSDELHLLWHQGFVRIAFRLAFWELLHAPTFESGLIDVVNRGGDADTNGAIAGALLGAHHGLDAIPGDWLDKVMQALPEDPDDPLTRQYHPRTLRDLVDRLLPDGEV